MDEEKSDRRWRFVTYVLIIVLVVSLLSNLYQYHRHSQYVGHRKSQNRVDMGVISTRVEHTSRVLNTFAEQIEEKEPDEENYHKDLHSLWRKAIFKSNDINFYSGRISHRHMEDELSGNWRDVQYILFQLEKPLRNFTYQFIEGRSYTLTADEIEKIKAIAEAYGKIQKGIETEPELSIQRGLIDSLTEPMKTVDPHYSTFLETRHTK